MGMLIKSLFSFILALTICVPDICITSWLKSDNNNNVTSFIQLEIENNTYTAISTSKNKARQSSP